MGINDKDCTKFFEKNGILEKYVDYNDKGAKQICDDNKQGGKYVYISSSY